MGTSTDGGSAGNPGKIGSGSGPDDELKEGDEMYFVYCMTHEHETGRPYRARPIMGRLTAETEVTKHAARFAGHAVTLIVAHVEKITRFIPASDTTEPPF